METLKSVFSDFKVEVEEEATLRLLNVAADTEEYAKYREIYEKVAPTATRAVKPCASFVLKDNDVFGLEEELTGCKYAAFCFCTVGDAVSRKAEEQRAMGFADEAAVIEAVGDLSLMRVRATAFGYLAKAAAKQFLGLGEPLCPGADIPGVFNGVVVLETGAAKDFGVSVDDETDVITPVKSAAFICGCDAGLPMPFSSFTPPDCESCLRRDCEYCEYME